MSEQTPAAVAAAYFGAVSGRGRARPRLGYLCDPQVAWHQPGAPTGSRATDVGSRRASARCWAG